MKEKTPELSPCPAAKADGVLRYPIITGQEVEGWSRMRSETAETFHTGANAQTACFFMGSIGMFWPRRQNKEKMQNMREIEEKAK